MMLRRDRLLLSVTLTAIFTADLYFVLLPKLRHRQPGPGDGGCICPSSRGTNFTIAGYSGLTTPWPSNTTSMDLQGMEVRATDNPTDWGSKLGRLFAHPLYNIQTPELVLEERLLQSEEVMGYYRRKVSRWER